MKLKLSIFVIITMVFTMLFTTFTANPARVWAAGGPTIDSFAPVSASEGATVVITGEGFTGATSVTFGGVEAFDYTVDSDTQITAQVAYGSSGSASVTTPSGTGQKAGFTYIPPDTYSFDYLPLGNLHQVDHWVSSSPDSTMHHVAVPSVTGHDGSRAAQFLTTTSDDTATRVNDGNFSMPDFAANDNYVIEFETQSTFWGSQFGLIYDENGNGKQDGGENGWQLWGGRNSQEISLSTQGGVSVTEDNFAAIVDYVRYQIVIDRTGYGGAGSASVWYKDLTTNSAWQPVAGMQNVNMQFDTGAGSRNPANWNGIYLYSNGNGPASTFDNITFRQVEVSSRSATFSNTIVGANNTQQISLSGDHLTGHLNAVLTGDYVFSDGTQSLAGLNDGSAIDVIFRPTAEGTRSGTLVLQGEDMNAPLTIALSGIGDNTGTIFTFAGDGTDGYSGDGDLATSAQLHSPRDMAIDDAGNLYFGDSSNTGDGIQTNLIRKVDAGGIITTLIDGTKQAGGKSLDRPYGVALDHTGNVLYIADANNDRILKYELDSEALTEVATGTLLNSPNGVTVDGEGKLVIADTDNHRIIKVDPDAAGAFSLVAGVGTDGYSGDGGLATEARISYPEGAAIDGAGNIYIADYNHSVIRKIDTNRIITTVAGTGVTGYSGDGGLAVDAKLNAPESVDVDSAGNIYIGDKGGEPRIRMVDADTGIITTVAGTGSPGYSGDNGKATSAEMNFPQNVMVDSAGNIYFSDFKNHVIRKVRAPFINWAYGYPKLGTATNDSVSFKLKTTQPGKAWYVALTHQAPAPTAAQIKAGQDAGGVALAAHLTGEVQLAANTEADVSIASLTPAVYDIYIVAEYASGAEQLPLAKITAGVAGTSVNLAGIGTMGTSGDGGAATSAQFYNLQDAAVDKAGNIYISDNNRVRKIDARTGKIKTVAGKEGSLPYSGEGGLATQAQISRTAGIALDGSGNLYIAAVSDNRILKVDANTGMITTVAGTGAFGYSGDGGPAVNAKIFCPEGVETDQAGNVYFTDNCNNLVRKIDMNTGIITTVAGKVDGTTGTSGVPGSGGYNGDNIPAAQAQLNYPRDLAFDQAGNLYIADTYNNRVRKVDVNTGIITTVLGNGTRNGVTDGATATETPIDQPARVELDDTGNVYTEHYMIDKYSGRATRVTDGLPIVEAFDRAGNYIAFILNQNKVVKRFAPYLHLMSPTYPEDGTITGTSIELKVSANQDGTLYYTAQPAGSAQPGDVSVKAGQDAEGQPLDTGRAGQVNFTANTEASFTVSGLSANTSYDIYILMENKAETEQYPLLKVTKTTTQTDTNAVAADKEALEIGYAPGDSAVSVTQDVYLPTAGLNGTTIVWASNASNVVSVTGDVYRLNTGNATVTLTATISKGSASDTKTFDLNVIGNPVTVASIGQNHLTYTLNVGETHQTMVTAVYTDQSQQNVTTGSTYLSSNPAVASVSAGGLVTANAAGTATITAIYGGKSITQDLTVQETEPDFTLTLEVNPEHVVGDGVSQVSITGTVLTRGAQPTGVPNVPITFHFGSGTTVTQTVYTNNGGLAQITYTAPDIAGVNPRTEIVSVEAVDTATGAKTVKNVEVHYMPATINGVVKDHAGNPLKDAAISVSADFNNDGIVDFSAEGLTAADGSYSIVVPRGNWNYSVVIQKQIQLEGGHTVTVETTQTAPVGTLNGTGEQISSANKISGVLVAVNPDNTTTTTGALFGAGNVKAQITGTGGTVYSNTVTLDANGEFDVNNIPTGSYQINYQITSPEGDTLIGPTQTVTVGANGQVSVADSLIDPYGTVTDADSGQPIPGVTLTLKWALTANGHVKDDPVPLPELLGFAPNNNHNSQQTTAEGKYGWMVFPDEDYYIVASKSGYQNYSTLVTPPADVLPAGGSTSYINNGVIHVGNTIVQLDFSMTKLPSSSADPAPWIPGQPESGEVTDTSVTLKWNGIGGQTYNVYVNGEQAATGITGTSYTVTGLSPETEYVFTVTAVSGGMESAPSVEARVTTQPASSDSETANRSTKYVSGYPDGTFQPNREVSRAEMAVMLYRALQLNDAPTGKVFPDVPNAFWGRQSIASVSSQGIMIGYPDETFKPNKLITRAEMAVIADKVRHLELAAGEAPFADTKKSWANRYIAMAAAADLMQGYPDGTFKPDQPLTRAEAVAVINRLTHRDPLMDVSQPSWPDVRPDFWAYGDIEAASTTIKP